MPPRDVIVRGCAGRPVAYLHNPEKTLRARRRGGWRVRGRVVRVPLLPGRQPYAFLSYNNVLLEVRSDGRLHALVPTYDVPALDEAARAAWEAANVVVHPIDVSGVFRMGGSVRCLSAPLQRARHAAQ